ncbi:MAG: bifunctional oligoribonuclease/PAP phosphatase NrnA [Acidobacteriaceae bacterium]|nr:bifunctional oligoribonuclease/PAP phosphatase NrnA [Acidobacteriaceae bacterium]
MATTNFPSDDQAIPAVLGFLAERETFLVTSHARPDGDAIGSALGMMHLLESMGKQVTVAFSDPIPHLYRDIPGSERIVSELPETTFDCGLLLECDSIARSGYTTLPVNSLLNIDHHLSGRHFADLNWINPETCAVGAMVYQLVIASGHTVTPAMATCLYAAVLTDTGAFTFASTTASTFAMAEHLTRAGADIHGVTEAVYFSTRPSKMRLLAAALNRMEISGMVAWSWVTEADMIAAGATLEDCEGVVNYLIGLEGVCAAAFLREQPGLRNDFRLSLRSKGAVDVSRVAQQFSGGGHRNASGGSIVGPLDEVLHRVVSALRAACAVSA